MKKHCIHINFISAIVMLSVLSFQCCNTSKSETKDAKAQSDALALIKIVQEHRIHEKNEYDIYKADAEVRLMENDRRISLLKENVSFEKKSYRNQYKHQVHAMELENEKLKSKIRAHAHETAQYQWNIFKTEFNRDMDKLTQSIAMVDERGKYE